MGNHDLAYFADFGKKVRYDMDNASIVRGLLIEMLPRMRIATLMKINGKTVVFSHGPILTDWIMATGSVRNIQELVKTLNNSISTLNSDSGRAVGLLKYLTFYRGGNDPCGSPVWADLREIEIDGKEIVDTVDYSIFAHTGLDSPKITSRWADLDCRRAFRLTPDLRIVDI